MNSTTTTSSLIERMTGLPGGARSVALREALLEAGVRETSPGRGVLKSRQFAAAVTTEADDFVTVRTRVDSSLDAFDALARSSQLSGNARYAVTSGGWQLAADTRVDGVAHLTSSLQEIQDAFRLALATEGPKRRRRKTTPGDTGDAATSIAAAVSEAGWSKERVIETEPGWELQQRLVGRIIPVSVTGVGPRARISRVLLDRLPTDATALAALAHQALIFNAQLRCARVCAVNDQLVVETSLRCELITPDWIDFCGRAIAVAARAVRPALNLLMQDETVALEYSRAFLGTPVTSAPNPSATKGP